MSDFLQRGRCFFASLGLPGIGPCEGRTDPCHLIKAQVVRREVGGAQMWDPRIIVPGCRRHHSMLDHSRQLRVPREMLPPSVEEFAAEHGLGWWVEREYGYGDLAA